MVPETYCTVLVVSEELVTYTNELMNELYECKNKIHYLNLQSGLLLTESDERM